MGLQATVGAPMRRRKSAGDAGTPFPVFIRSSWSDVDVDDRGYVRRKLASKLGKFAADIQRVSVRLDDTNGPRGGIDARCRIKVTLHGLPPVVIESLAASMQAAIDGALARVGQAVKHPLQRRRAKPRRPARTAPRHTPAP